MNILLKGGVGIVETVGYEDPQHSSSVPELTVGILALPEPSLAVTVTPYNPRWALKLVKYAEYIPSPAVISGYPVPVSVNITSMVSPPGLLTLATTLAPDTGRDPCMTSAYNNTGSDI